jgi:hypothetical protein
MFENRYFLRRDCICHYRSVITVFFPKWPRNYQKILSKNILLPWEKCSKDREMRDIKKLVLNDINARRIEVNLHALKARGRADILLTCLLTYLPTYSREQSPSGKLTGSYLVKKFPAFYGTRSSLPHSQVHATCSYPEPARSSPYPHTKKKLDDSFRLDVAEIARVAWHVSFQHLQQEKTCKSAH